MRKKMGPEEMAKLEELFHQYNNVGSEICPPGLTLIRAAGEYKKRERALQKEIEQFSREWEISSKICHHPEFAEIDYEYCLGCSLCGYKTD